MGGCFFTSTKLSGGLGCPARRGAGGFWGGRRGGGKGGGWQSCNAITLPVPAPGWEVAQSEPADAMSWATPVVLWFSVLTDTGHPEAVSGRASVWAESRVIQGV